MIISLVRFLQDDLSINILCKQSILNWYYWLDYLLVSFLPCEFDKAVHAYLHRSIQKVEVGGYGFIMINGNFRVDLCNKVRNLSCLTALNEYFRSLSGLTRWRQKHIDVGRFSLIFSVIRVVNHLAKGQVYYVCLLNFLLAGDTSDVVYQSGWPHCVGC